jgi:hypothetical protein
MVLRVNWLATSRERPQGCPEIGPTLVTNASEFRNEEVLVDPEKSLSLKGFTASIEVTY